MDAHLQVQLVLPYPLSAPWGLDFVLDFFAIGYIVLFIPYVSYFFLSR